MPFKIAGESLNACSGCEISILDMGEKFLKLLAIADIVHLPLLMDNKHTCFRDNDWQTVFPKADVGLISGSIKTREHLEMAHAMREACDLIVAFGTCATHGGIPSLANSFANDEILEKYFSIQDTDSSCVYPSESVPGLLETCSAIGEHIHVDIHLPGCPPHPDHIYRVLKAVEKGERFILPGKSVCDNCSALRDGFGKVKSLKRTLDLPVWRKIDGSEEGFRCFIEQGFLCLGPVTRNGCGGDAEPPRCISAQVPCRGCYGPVNKEGNQRLAMLNALASNGIDTKSLPETVSLLRFSGSHGLLQPAPGKKESE